MLWDVKAEEEKFATPPSFWFVATKLLRETVRDGRFRRVVVLDLYCCVRCQLCIFYAPRLFFCEGVNKLYYSDFFFIYRNGHEELLELLIYLHQLGIIGIFENFPLDIKVFQVLYYEYVLFYFTCFCIA